MADAESVPPDPGVHAPEAPSVDVHSGHAGDSRRDRQKRAREARIFRSAMSGFRRDGFDATTMQGIADGAGVSRGTVFNYFPYKEAILVRYFASELAELRTTFRTGDDPIGDLYRLFDELADFVAANRALVLPLSYELLNPDPERSRAAYAQLPLAALVERLLTRARDGGRLRGDHSLRRLARHVVNGFFLTALQWAAYRSDRSIHDEVRIDLGLLLEGLEVPAGS